MYNEHITHIYENIYTNVTKDELVKLQQLSHNKIVCVEIGSYLGASAYAITSGFTNTDQKLYCIDIWKSNTKLRPDPKDGKNLFDTFKYNIKKYDSSIIPIVDFSYNAIEYFKENNIKIDFLFIDGDHTYEGVKKDWDLYSKIMNPQGVVVFHDWGWSTVSSMIKDHVLTNTINHNNLPNTWWGEIS
jgi:predicted O-methyltransferase YrrM